MLFYKIKQQSYAKTKDYYQVNIEKGDLVAISADNGLRKGYVEKVNESTATINVIVRRLHRQQIRKVRVEKEDEYVFMKMIVNLEKVIVIQKGAID